MIKNINFYIFVYLSILFLFSVFFLYQKHDVANDSTISEWLINYEGGFTKRGLIGQLSIYLSNFFIIKLRDTIFILQTLLVGTIPLRQLHKLLSVRITVLMVLVMQ